MVDATNLFRNEIAVRNPYGRRLRLGQGMTAAAVALDLFAIMAAAMAAGVSYHLVQYGSSGEAGRHLTLGALVAVFYIVPRLQQGAYDLTEIGSCPRAPVRMFHLWNAAFAATLALGFVSKLAGDYSRGSVILFYCVGLAALLATHRSVVALVRTGFERGWLATRNVLLVGTEERISRFLQHNDPARSGLNILGIEALPGDAGGALAAPELSNAFAEALRGAAAEARRLEAGDVVLLLPWSDVATINRCADTLMGLPAAISLGPERVLDRFSGVRLCNIGGAVGLTLVRPPLGASDLIAKRLLDMVGATVGLIVLAPLLLLVALAVKLDSPGPVIYRQRRNGFNQAAFDILKFRTMRHGTDQGPFRQTSVGDGRVTRVGRILRRFNLDELPQFLNVLKGDMSLVGPRPHAVEHNQEFEERITLYARRHNVKPGITGWAQVNGFRGSTEGPGHMEARIRHDLHYIDNWSLWFDVYIIALTFVSPRAFRNAR